MRPPNAPDSPPMKGATPHPTGWWWALGFGNPLARLEWVGWRRRLIRQGGIGLVALAALGAVFFARYGVRGAPGYSFSLRQAVRGRQPALINPFSMPQPPTLGERMMDFLADVAVGAEAAFLRLTTLLPWALVILAVRRVRRGGHLEALRMTALSPRDWVAGLAGPPALLSALALGVFLAFVVYPNQLMRYAPLETARRMALFTLPAIGFEGMANALLICALTLREALRSRRAGEVVLRTLFWLVALCALHSAAVVAVYRGIALIPPVRASASGAWYGFWYPALLRNGPLWVVGVAKAGLAIWLFRRLARRFFDFLAREAEQLG